MKALIRVLRVALLHLIHNIYPSLSLPKRAVIVAPHPDDEVIGCGGLIQALVERGTPPHVIILTGGEGSHRGCCDISAEELITGRHNLTIKAAETMGLPLSHIHCLQYPDGGVALEHPETERLAALLQELKPDAIFVPHHGEGWSDHLKAAEIVKALIGMFNENEDEDSKQEQRDLTKHYTLNSKQKRSASLNSKPELYSYCVWMWYYNVWDFRMKDAFLLRLSEKQHRIKQKAIEQYVTPLAPCGKPWSGVLPKSFLKATRWDKELYFLVR
ncbi:MAG: PIG-L family deacetylase [Bacteroidaceae bacterium]|nr:PIG-L family deacetylase [Bacteroidaceae bacterium]